MDNIQNKLIQNSMTYLSDIATYINTGSANNILKSYYLTKCRIHEANELINIPANCTNETVRCPKCCILYSECNPKICIKPEQRKSKFCRKMLKKREHKLTKYQRNYMKNVTKESENSLVITCGFCKKVVAKSLKKPVDEVAVKEIHQQTKKRRKKDKYSGLNASAVAAVVSQVETTNYISLENKNKTHTNIKNNNKKINIKPIKKTATFKQNEKNKKAHKMNKLSDMLLSANPVQKGGLKQFLDSMQ